jgi:DNA-binding HxlR family transcriptional regulator
MKGYGQFCPVAKASEVFAERWTPLVIRELLAGSTHFNDIHRGVPLMSRTLLSQRLKQLEDIGVVKRRQNPRGSEYHLTDAGREFAPIIRYLGEWGQRWFRPKFGPDELDVRVLTWDMRRSVKPEAFPPGRICVRFDFCDQPSSKRSWWMVSDGGEADLCPTDPGYEVDLFVMTDLPTFTKVWMGDLSVKSAVATGKIELDGPRELRRCFEQWLGLSDFAGVKAAKCAA